MPIPWIFRRVRTGVCAPVETYACSPPAPDHSIAVLRPWAGWESVRGTSLDWRPRPDIVTAKGRKGAGVPFAARSSPRFHKAKITSPRGCNVRACDVRPHPQSDALLHAFRGLMRHRGLREIIRCDLGSPFAFNRLERFSSLSLGWIEQGIAAHLSATTTVEKQATQGRTTGAGAGSGSVWRSGARWPRRLPTSLKSQTTSPRPTTEPRARKPATKTTPIMNLSTS